MTTVPVVERVRALSCVSAASSLRRACLRLAAVLLTLTVAGCGEPEMSRSDKDRDLREGLEAIERIEADRSIPSDRKRAMIERIRMEVEELTGEKMERNSPTPETSP